MEAVAVHHQQVAFAVFDVERWSARLLDGEDVPFVFFVNDPELLHFSYRRYLENRIRESFGFEGTAIRMRFRRRSEDRQEESA